MGKHRDMGNGAGIIHTQYVAVSCKHTTIQTTVCVWLKTHTKEISNISIPRKPPVLFLVVCLKLCTFTHKNPSRVTLVRCVRKSYIPSNALHPNTYQESCTPHTPSVLPPHRYCDHIEVRFHIFSTLFTDYGINYLRLKMYPASPLTTWCSLLTWHLSDGRFIWTGWHR